ncbi:MAG TPA: hypothetical protein PKM65_04095 [Spirochaetota bacterium]|nr:hypothetical protein [Spirochaetota bacterium]HNT10736.1 hypothetical protein [Spirochaetota bacterium]
MKKIALIVFLVVLLVASCVIAYYHLYHQTAYVDYFQGTVELVRNDAKSQVSTYKLPIMANDVITTSSNSTAFIQLGPDILLVLYPHSLVSIEKARAECIDRKGGFVVELRSGEMGIFAERVHDEDRLSVKTGKSRVTISDACACLRRTGEAAALTVRSGSAIVESAGEKKSFGFESASRVLIHDGGMSIIKGVSTACNNFKELYEIRPIAAIRHTSPNHVQRYFEWRLDALRRLDALKMKNRMQMKIAATPSEQDDMPILVKGHSATLGVARFETSSVDDAVVDAITKNVIKRLAATKGKKSVMYLGAGTASAKVARHLVGRISALEDGFIVSIRIIDDESWRMLFNETREVKTLSLLQETVDGMVSRIESLPAIWSAN